MVQSQPQSIACAGIESDPDGGVGAGVPAMEGQPARQVGRAAPVRPLTADQQALAARHVGLVGVHLRTRVRTGRRVRTFRCDPEELFQAGCVALVQAAGRYDAGRDGPFAAYALPRIRRAVHETLLADEFLMQLPGAQARKGRGRAVRSGAPGRRFWPTPTEPGPEPRGRPGDETIRHALRRCFEQAVARATEELARDSCRRSDAAPVLNRIAAERVLVGSSRERTPVRRLAGELGLHGGQVSEYEHRILAEAREQLRRDAGAQLLIRFAGLDPAGFDAPVDANRRRRLLNVRLRQFEHRFAELDAPGRARLLYSLVERSTGKAAEVARNLFLLTLSRA
jgi:hypothetical protein